LRMRVHPRRDTLAMMTLRPAGDSRAGSMTLVYGRGDDE
jgi:hypothetical protein